MGTGSEEQLLGFLHIILGFHSKEYLIGPPKPLLTGWNTVSTPDFDELEI